MNVFSPDVFKNHQKGRRGRDRNTWNQFTKEEIFISNFSFSLSPTSVCASIYLSIEILRLFYMSFSLMSKIKQYEI